MKQYLKTLETLKCRKEAYFALNLKVVELQENFPTHLNCCDDQLEPEIVKLLDEIIEKECGLTELASYYLYECNPRGLVSEKCGKEFVIETIEDLEKAINHFASDDSVLLRR